MNQMMFEIALGTGLIVSSIIISVVMIGLAIQVLLFFAGKLSRGNHMLESMMALVATTTDAICSCSATTLNGKSSIMWSA